MASTLQNGIKRQPIGAYILDGVSPEEVALSMIDRGQKDPFYIFNMDEAYRHFQHFKEVMPRVQIFYAMKANDWDLMLKLAVSQNVGFDCASPGEISKILRLGVSPLSIIYAIPTKTPEQMTFAKEAGVKHTTFDSSYELKKIKQYWPDANLLIRIRVDGKSVYQLGEKFGCDFEDEATGLLDEAASLGLKVVGVAFHVGSGCSSIDSHTLGLQRARALFDHEMAAGRRMKIVDIGGGFLSAQTDSIDQVAKIINKALEEYFPDPAIQVIAEPGRYLCDTCATLYNSINNIRRVMKNNKPVNLFYLNDGLHGTLRYAESWHTVERLKAKNEELDNRLQLILILELQKLGKCPSKEEYFDLLSARCLSMDLAEEDAILWGPTCDSTDRIMEKYTVRLPRCSPFDWLVFKTQGAYSYGFQGEFSCLEIPKMRAVVSTELWHKIKDDPVFNLSDFVVSPDISLPLPTLLPPLPQRNVVYSAKTPTLII